MVEQRLKSTVKVLSGIDTTTQREKLSTLLEIAEEIIQKVKAIGLKSPAEEHEVEIPPTECQLETNAQLLRTFLDSVAPTKKGIKLKFDSDGLRITESNEKKSLRIICLPAKRLLLQVRVGALRGLLTRYG